MSRKGRPLRKSTQARKTRGRMARPRPSRPRHALPGTKSEPNAERRSASVHAAVLAAATRLIRRYGYNRVTIEAIAAEAGAGKQTIYRWWPSKAALCLELYGAATADKGRKPKGAAGGQDLATCLRRMGRTLGVPAGKAMLAGLVAEAAHDPGVARALRDLLVRHHRALLRPILERGQKRGEIRRGVDLDLAADMVTAAMWFRLLLGRAPLDGRFVKRLGAQLLRGIAAR